MGFSAHRVPSLSNRDRGGRLDEVREHWHGATPDRFMAHLAPREPDESGQVVTWLEQATNDDYDRLLLTAPGRRP